LSPKVSAELEQAYEVAEARGLLTPETITLGISYDDPSITPPEKCPYDGCIIVPPNFTAEPTVNVKDVSGGKYAVSEYVGTAGEIMGAWSQIFSSWLPSSGYQPEDCEGFDLSSPRRIATAEVPLRALDSGLGIAMVSQPS
jgi:DNA gyrase inhibitor GyrI